MLDKETAKRLYGGMTAEHAVPRAEQATTQGGVDTERALRTLQEHMSELQRTLQDIKAERPVQQPQVVLVQPERSPRRFVTPVNVLVAAGLVVGGVVAFRAYELHNERAAAAANAPGPTAPTVPPQAESPSYNFLQGNNTPVDASVFRAQAAIAEPVMVGGTSEDGSFDAASLAFTTGNVMFRFSLAGTDTVPTEACGNVMGAVYTVTGSNVNGPLSSDILAQTLAQLEVPEQLRLVMGLFATQDQAVLERSISQSYIVLIDEKNNELATINGCQRG
jgi:hypothetical protein